MILRNQGLVGMVDLVRFCGFRDLVSRDLFLKSTILFCRKRTRPRGFINLVEDRTQCEKDNLPTGGLTERMVPLKFYDLLFFQENRIRSSVRRKTSNKIRFEMKKKTVNKIIKHFLVFLLILSKYI